MKKIIKLTLTLSVLVTQLACAESTFTTVASLDNKLVYAAVKESKPEMEMISHLVEIQADKLSSQKIKLPSELDNREVIALLPAQKGLLVVVTQITRGGGDQPLLHTYDSQKKSWNKVGKADCVSFAKIKLTKDSVEFACEETDAKGNVKIVAKAVPLKNITLAETGDMILPVTKIDSKNLKAELQGDQFEWNKVKVNQDKKEKVFTP